MARQIERREATRGAILAAARRLFGEAGFAATTVDQIAEAAGVAKGAVYHHFATKEAVFEAVFEAASEDLAAAVGQAARQAPDVLATLSVAARAYFDLCAGGPMRRIILADGPAVLGWARWREIDARHFAAGVPLVLNAAIAQGLIEDQPVEPLATLILGAMTEAAVACAASPDPSAAGRAYAEALERLLAGLSRAPS